MAAELRNIALTLALLTAGPAAAQGVSVADLDRIQSEAILYRAELARENTARELREARGGGASVTLGSTAEQQLPAALGRFGANGRSYVRFGYSDGSFAEAAIGESIPGGYRVSKVDDAGVELARGNVRHRVGFAMRAPTPTPAVPAAPALPSAPPFTPPSPMSVPPMVRPQ